MYASKVKGLGPYDSEIATRRWNIIQRVTRLPTFACISPPLQPALERRSTCLMYQLIYKRVTRLPMFVCVSPPYSLHQNGVALAFCIDLLFGKLKYRGYI